MSPLGPAIVAKTPSYPVSARIFFGEYTAGFFTFFKWMDKQKKLSTNSLILFTSELTYSIYLFHNWLYDRIKQMSIAHGLFHKDIYALLLLLILCAMLVKIIEKPGIQLGRRLLKHLPISQKIFAPPIQPETIPISIEP
ncbi:MAG: hypothetical protein Q8R79_09275 [Legionellaceae bacterium]|nr:hypothetical protein [Legionellaceae bacterium]